jgi:hypothetical protein
VRNNDAPSSIDRKFREITGRQVRPDMAETLCDFVDSVTDRGGVSESAVLYVLSKLWWTRSDPRDEDNGNDQKKP